MDLGSPAPGLVAVAGDWHRNGKWAVSVLRDACGALAAEERKIILQLGDFGIWRGQAGVDYLIELDDALAELDATLFFLDGNHEDHKLLADITARSGKAGQPTPVGPRIFHLPRGMRWSWHGRTWLALGGAASVDRAARTEGVRWFREEEITLLQAALALAPGTADVMLTHECPRRACERLPLGPPPPWWDLEVSRKHQEFLDRVIAEAEPSRVYHGHMHLAYEGTFGYPHGDVRIRGLGCDGQDGNWGICDTRTMSWSTPEEVMHPEGG